MTIPPVVKTVSVGLDPTAAFALFTTRIGTWWPTQTFSVSAEQGKPSRSVDIEGHVGGQIIEIADDASRHIWGTVVEWLPGAVFASTWHPGRTEETVTQIRVTFEREGTGTLVTLTHSGWEALGEEGSNIRDGYTAGWVKVLGCFEAAV